MGGLGVKRRGEHWRWYWIFSGDRRKSNLKTWCHGGLFKLKCFILVNVWPLLTRKIAPTINPSELDHRPNGSLQRGEGHGMEFQLFHLFGSLINSPYIQRSKTLTFSFLKMHSAWKLKLVYDLFILWFCASKASSPLWSVKIIISFYEELWHH